MLTRKTGTPSTNLDASLQRVLAYGYGYPALAWLQPGDLRQVWEQEWWNWSIDEMRTLYERHRATVNAWAQGAGLSKPWVLDAIDRERDVAAAPWRPDKESR